MGQFTYTTPTGTTKGLFEDMTHQTHLLVAGASGSGKSVLINGMITTLLYRFPLDVAGGAQFILIDPKRVELSPYKNTPHCIGYASEPAEMVAMLRKAIDITDRRYKEMVARGLRMYDGSDIFVFIEELADLMTTNGREVQPLIQRLCQIGRASRIRVVVATQTPIVKVIPTEIKVNFDSTVALRTRCAQDSRNIIGVNGAECLPRYGECLYYTPEQGKVLRYDVPYIDEAEQGRLIRWWEHQTMKEEVKPAPLPLPTQRRGFLQRLIGR